MKSGRVWGASGCKIYSTLVIEHGKNRDAISTPALSSDWRLLVRGEVFEIV